MTKKAKLLFIIFCCLTTLSLCNLDCSTFDNNPSKCNFQSTCCYLTNGVHNLCLDLTENLALENANMIGLASSACNYKRVLLLEELNDEMEEQSIEVENLELEKISAQGGAEEAGAEEGAEETIADSFELTIFPKTGGLDTLFEFKVSQLNANTNTNYLNRIYFIVPDNNVSGYNNVEIELKPLSANKVIVRTFGIPETLFGKQSSSNAETLLVDVYCKINKPNGTSATILKKQVTLAKTVDKSEAFKNLKDFGNFDTKKITAEELNSKAQVLNSLTSDLKDAVIITSPKPQPPKSLPSNIPETLGRLVASLPTCETLPTFCNSRGACYGVGRALFCKCYPGYTGSNCQMSQANLQLWLEIQNKVVDTYVDKITSGGVLDASMISSVTNLASTSSAVVTSAKDLDKFANILSKFSQLASDPANAALFKSSSESINNLTNTILNSNKKSADNDRYNNLINSLLKGETVEADYTVEYIDVTKTGRILQGGIDLNRIKDPNVVYVVKVTDMSKVPLTEEQEKLYTDNIAKLRANNINIALGILKATDGETDIPYTSDDMNSIYKKMKKETIQTFDFINYFTITNDFIKSRRSYFDAQSCIQEFLKKNFNSIDYDLSTISFIFIDRKVPEMSFNLKLFKDLISTTHSISFYDNNGKKLDLNCDSGISHFLPINVGEDNIDFIKDYSSGSEKYSAKNPYTLPKKYTGVYLPYFIFTDGTIDSSETEEQRNVYYKSYTVTLDMYDETANNLTNIGTEFSYITEDTYIVGKSKHLSDYMSLGKYTPINTAAKNYYFMDFNQLYTCSENVKGNMCFYIVILFFAFHIIFLSIVLTIGLIKECGKNSHNSFVADLEKEYKINLNDNERFGDVRIFKSGNKNGPTPPTNKVKDEYINVDNQKEQSDIQLMAVNNIIKNQENEDKKVQDAHNNLNYVPNKPDNEIQYNTPNKSYNIFYFILFRNIYVTSFNSTSPFAPKYKSITKFAFFIYLLFLVVVLCCVFIDQDLTNWLIKNQGQLAGFIFIAVFSTNVALILLGLIYQTWNKDREEVITSHNNGHGVDSLITRTVRSNLIKTIILNCVNIGLAGILYYWSVGFCAVWFKWAHNLLILWLLALIADFVVAEICWEFIIYFFYLFRGNKFGQHLFRFVLSIKNLRNYS